MGETKPECEYRELKGSKLVGYALGSLGIIMPISLFNAYSFQFYVFTIGLDSLYVSIGIFIGLFSYAFMGVIMGVISDNKKPSKLGKRRPFILMGMPGIIIFSTLLWMPPKVPIGITDEVYWPTAIYLWIMAAALNISVVIAQIPYMSMLPEQCQTPENRLSVAATQGIFNVFGTAIGVLLPILLQSVIEDPQNTMWYQPSGEYLTYHLPLLGAGFGVLCVLFLFTAFLSVDESFFLNTNLDTNKITISETFHRIFSPFQNQKYKNFLVDVIFFNMSMRILIVVIVPFLTYVLMLLESEFIIFALILVPFAIIGFIFWNKQIVKKGLIPTYSLAIIVICIALFAGSMFLLPIGKITMLIVGGLDIGIALACLVGGYLFPNPIISAIVEEKAQDQSNELSLDENISKLSGNYFGLNLFVLNIASGLANIILGLIFTGGNERNALFIVLAMPIAGIFQLFGLFFLKRVSLKIDQK